MALSTYAELKTAIASTLNRTDLTSAIPDFVALAEEDIRNDVRVRAMEALATGTLTGETLAHPTRFIDARRLLINGKQYEYNTPERYQDASESGAALRMFTSIGESFYILRGASGDTYSLIYSAGFAPFSADSDTNWVLTYGPSVYLYGACKHASIYLKDDADLAKYAALYQASVKRLNDRENTAKATGSPLSVYSLVQE